jgi:CheY-like chemotaxis protein
MTVLSATENGADCRPSPEEPAETTVLVVDDSPVTRRLVGALVERQPGFKAAYACDGRDALAVLARLPCAAVVTDLHMPEMDGLELVEKVRGRFPLVPVVLMTAQGSEEVAVRALQGGAASYVPKSALARDLADTLDRVLAASKVDRRRQGLLECVSALDCRFVLENDAALVPVLAAHLQEYVVRMRLCDANGRIRLGVALEEALLNGMHHGNLELSSDLRRPPVARPRPAGRGRGRFRDPRRRPGVRRGGVARPDRPGEPPQGQRPRPPLDPDLYGRGEAQRGRQRDHPRAAPAGRKGEGVTGRFRFCRTPAGVLNWR